MCHYNLYFTSLFKYLVNMFECSMIGSETRNRLRRRAEEDDETYDDVINYLLDETAVEVALEELVRTATEQYEGAAQVAIEHCSLTNPSELTVIVWGAACLEEDLEIVPPEATVGLTRDDGTLQLPVKVQGQGYLPPSRDSLTRTTVYLDSDEGSVDVQTGVEYFKEKFQDPEAWEEEHSGNEFESLRIQ